MQRMQEAWNSPHIKEVGEGERFKKQSCQEMAEEITGSHLTWLPWGHPQITFSFEVLKANLSLDLVVLLYKRKRKETRQNS